jgi:hypothetical protein
MTIVLLDLICRSTCPQVCYDERIVGPCMLIHVPPEVLWRACCWTTHVNPCFPRCAMMSVLSDLTCTVSPHVPRCAMTSLFLDLTCKSMCPQVCYDEHVVGPRMQVHVSPGVPRWVCCWTLHVSPCVRRCVMTSVLLDLTPVNPRVPRCAMMRLLLDIACKSHVPRCAMRSMFLDLACKTTCPQVCYDKGVVGPHM